MVLLYCVTEMSTEGSTGPSHLVTPPCTNKWDCQSVQHLVFSQSNTEEKVLVLMEPFKINVLSSVYLAWHNILAIFPALQLLHILFMFPASDKAMTWRPVSSEVAQGTASWDHITFQTGLVCLVSMNTSWFNIHVLQKSESWVEKQKDFLRRFLSITVSQCQCCPTVC